MARARSASIRAASRREALAAAPEERAGHDDCANGGSHERRVVDRTGHRCILWTDTTNYRNSNYHRATDTPDTLDYRFVADVSELVSDAVLAAR